MELQGAVVGSTVMMGYRRLNNRRGIGWLLTLALLAMGLPSGATWQCLNGTPCPANCPMLRGGAAKRADRSTVQRATESPRCSHCVAEARLPGIASHAPTPACSTPGCVLLVHGHTPAALAESQHLLIPLLALPPPAVQVVAPPLSRRFSPSVSLLLNPERFLRPCAGRAPPICA